MTETTPNPTVEATPCAKFLIRADELRDALKPLDRCIARRCTYPIYSLCRVNVADSDRASFEAVNYVSNEAFFANSMNRPIACSQSGKFLAPAKELLERIQGLEGAVEIEAFDVMTRRVKHLTHANGQASEVALWDKSTRIDVTCGSMEFSLSCDDSVDRWIDAPNSAKAKLENCQSFEVESNEFKRALEKVLPFASRDANRPSINGVLLTGYSGEFHAVATSGYLLADFELETVTDDFGSWRDCVIPYEVAKVAIASLPKKGFVEISTFSLGEGETFRRYAKIWSERFQITTELFNGTFPNWRSLMPGSSSFSRSLDLPCKETASIASKVVKSYPKRALHRDTKTILELRDSGTLAISNGERSLVDLVQTDTKDQAFEIAFRHTDFKTICDAFKGELRFLALFGNRENDHAFFKSYQYQFRALCVPVRS